MRYQILLCITTAKAFDIFDVFHQDNANPVTCDNPITYTCIEYPYIITTWSSPTRTQYIIDPNDSDVIHTVTLVETPQSIATTLTSTVTIQETDAEIYRRSRSTTRTRSIRRTRSTTLTEAGGRSVPVEAVTTSAMSSITQQSTISAAANSSQIVSTLSGTGSIKLTSTFAESRTTPRSIINTLAYSSQAFSTLFGTGPIKLRSIFAEGSTTPRSIISTLSYPSRVISTLSVTGPVELRSTFAVGSTTSRSIFNTLAYSDQAIVATLYGTALVELTTTPMMDSTTQRFTSSTLVYSSRDIDATLYDTAMVKLITTTTLQQSTINISVYSSQAIDYTLYDTAVAKIISSPVMGSPTTQWTTISTLVYSSQAIHATPRDTEQVMAISTTIVDLITSTQVDSILQTTTSPSYVTTPSKAADISLSSKTDSGTTALTAVSIGTPTTISATQTLSQACSITAAVANGDFETPPFSPWATSRPNNNFVLAFTSSKVQSGTRAAQVFCPGSSSGLVVSLTQTIEVCPGTVYTLSAWGSGASNGGTKCYLQLCIDNTCQTALRLDTTYTKTNFSFNSGVHSTTIVTVNAWCEGNTDRTLYIDTVEIKAS